MERAFRIFDRDGNGTVSMAEFIETMHAFAGQTSDEKLVFLFKVYDLDGEYIYPTEYFMNLEPQSPLIDVCKLNII